MALLFIGTGGVVYAASADNTVQITATVEGGDFHIGDRIKLTLIAENAKGFELLFCLLLFVIAVKLVELRTKIRSDSG